MLILKNRYITIAEIFIIIKNRKNRKIVNV